MADGTILRHEVSGNGRKLGLLLLHPLGVNLRFWDDCVALWQDRLSCVAVDLRNISHAGAEPGPVSIAEHAEDLRGLQTSLGFDQLIPVGCAISTMIAAGYAAGFPDLVAALVLTNATPRSSPQARTMLADRGKLVREKGIAAILPQAVERAFLNQPQDERYRRYYDAFAGQSAEDYAFACEASADYDASGYLPVIHCPALVVAGEHDVLLPPALASEVARLLPGAELQIMDAAHFVPYQAPAAFASAVLNFLADRKIIPA